MSAHPLERDPPGPGASPPVADPAPNADAPREGWRPYLLGLLPSAAVFLLLGAVAVWGVRTEWKFGNPFSRGSAKKEEEKGDHRETEVIPGPAAQPGGCPLSGTRVRLTAAEVAGRMGLRVAPVESRPLDAVVTAPAELSYDETRLARLSSRVSGSVVRVEKQVGDQVRKGDLLALVDAAAVGKAKTDLLEAIAQLDQREKEAAATAEAARKGAVSELQAERDAAAARTAQVRVLAAQQALVNLGLPVSAAELRKASPVQQSERLRLLGLPPEYAKTLESGGLASDNLIPVSAPLDGQVVERSVVPGEVIDPAKTLFAVADLSRIWVLADVRTEEADRVAVGQRLNFAANGHSGEALAGRVVWTSTAIDSRTRTLRVRAEVENPGAHWRARTFGTARITLRDAKTPSTVVHPDAVQREGDCRYVFVRLDATTFEARAVRLGVRGEVDGPQDGGGTRKEPRVEILDGIRPGEEVVTAGSYILKAEVLKGRLGDAH